MDASAPPTPQRPGLLSLPEMLFQNAYVWMIFFSAMDVVLTGLILRSGDGVGLDPNREINPVARLVIAHWGMLGASFFKFALVMLVIVIAETIGRMKPLVGRTLAWTAVGISAFPVVWSLTLLTVHRMHLFDQAEESGGSTIAMSLMS